MFAFFSRLEIQISRTCGLSDLHLRPSLIRGTSLFFSSTLHFKKSVWVKPQSFNAIVPTRLASLFCNEEPVTGRKKLLHAGTNAITNIIATNACVTIPLVASATGALVGLSALAVGKVDREFKRAQAVEGDVDSHFWSWHTLPSLSLGPAFAWQLLIAKNRQLRRGFNQF